MQESILQDSFFEQDEHGHGGNRRTLQIAELIQSAGFLIKGNQKFKVTRLRKYLAGFYFLARHPLKLPLSYRKIGIYGQQFLNYQQILKNPSSTKLFIWEATADYLAPCFVKAAGYKVLALPHNLESLVLSNYESLNLKSLLGRFENEIKSLNQSDAIFCISREEQWLLKLCGVSADFLPYYPPQSISANLLKLREQRATSTKTRFLILGTALNYPTLLGMIEQLQWLKTIRAEIEFEVDIAGYGTEQLQEYCDHPSFNLLGAIDPEKLDNLMLEAKAILVHQRAGVGALTRIPEMITAGIPVIANSNTCRSAFEYPGVYCYDSHSELSELICRSLPIPDLLQRPINAEKRFINCLKSFAADLP
jgi:hypothetical protein